MENRPVRKMRFQSSQYAELLHKLRKIEPEACRLLDPYLLLVCHADMQKTKEKHEGADDTRRFEAVELAETSHSVSGCKR